MRWLILQCLIICCVKGQLENEEQAITQTNVSLSSFASIGFNEWEVSLELIDSDYDIHAFTLSSQDTLDSLRTNDDRVFAISEIPISAQERNLKQLPILVSLVVPAYNLPSLSLGERVVFDREVLADIFLGHITTWNDERIVNSNPSIASKLPNETITLVVRKDGSGTSYIFTSALTKFSTEWAEKFGTISQYPPSFYGNRTTSVISVTGGWNVQGAIESTPYSLSYIGAPMLLFTGYQGYGLMRDKNGRLIFPIASQFIQFNSVDSGEISDIPGMWPIAGYIYCIYHPTYTTKCDSVKVGFLFLRYVIDNNQLNEGVVKKGYMPPSPLIISNAILPENITCDGEQVVKTIYESHSGDPGYITILFFSMLLLALTAFLMFSLVKIIFHEVSLTKSSVLYIALICGGAAFSYTSIIAWYQTPSLSVCRARLWLTTLGPTFLLVGVVNRIWQFYRVYKYLLKSDRLSTYGFAKAKENFVIVGAAVMLQVVILVIWQSIDGPFITLEPEELFLREFEARCSCGHWRTWLGIEVAYFALLLLWGLYVVYATWFVRESIRESRGLLISMYNVIALLCVITPIILLVDFREDGLFYFAASSIMVVTTSLVFSLFAPIVLKKIIPSSSDKLEKKPTADTSDTPSKNKGSTITTDLDTEMEMRNQTSEVELP